MMQHQRPHCPSQPPSHRGSSVGVTAIRNLDLNGTTRKQGSNSMGLKVASTEAIMHSLIC